jgi:hypothetical protein
LAKGEVDLRVGNGAKAAALVVGTYVLTLPSGLLLNLEKCYYIPAISRNIIQFLVWARLVLFYNKGQHLQ